MSKFFVRKKISLTFLGEGWENCHITVKALSSRDFKKIQAIAPKTTEDVDENMRAMDAMIDLVKDQFVSGLAFDGEAEVELEAGDLDELPMEALTAIIESLAGKTDPKS